MAGERVFCADIVACIDVSANAVNCLEDVKKNFKYFYESFEQRANTKYVERGETIHERVKVIAFRSYGVDAEPMVETRFFDMDNWNDRAEMYKFIDSLEAKGGENGRSCSLEALTCALKSDWVRTRSIRRHITLLFTNAEATPLGINESAPGYPEDMPKDMEEFRAIWDDEQIMKKRAKRLIIFAPDVEPWTETVTWDGVIHIPSMAGADCDDIYMDIVLRMLFNSL